MAPTPSLATMPGEIVDMIFQYLPQQGLHAMMLTNLNFSEVTAKYLYDAPDFASTYRYAQFAHVVSNRPHYAHMVHSMDLSKFNKAFDSEGGGISIAGWREWKYRNHDMYYVQDPTNPNQRSYQRITTSHQVMKTIDQSTGSHPPPSPMLMSFSLVRDVPIGSICHVLAACRNINKVDLSRLQLASDFLVLPPGASRPKPLPADSFGQPASPDNLPVITAPSQWTSTPSPRHELSPWPDYLPSGPILPSITISSPPFSPLGTSLPPSPLINHTFVSTLPKPTYQLPYHQHQLAPLYADEIIYWLVQLQELGELNISHSVWLSTSRVAYLVREAKGDSDMKLDFRESGMQKAMKWGVEAGREEVRRALEV